MKKVWFGVFIVLIAAMSGSCEKETSPPQKEKAPQITTAEKPSAEKASVIAPGAEPVELANIDQYIGDRSKTEGPVADAEGNVYFSDPYGTKVYMWSPDSGLSIFTEKFNGPNGLALDPRATHHYVP